MSYTIIILLALLIIGPILVAYYYDYTANPQGFSFSLKTLGKGFFKGLIFVALYFGINKTYEYFIPLNKNHGMEFNSEREQIGIPTLKSNWQKSNNESGQFVTYWWKNQPRNGHFKKVIEYGLLDCQTETDYYQNENIKGTFAWSKYDFDKRKFEYFIESPNESLVSVADNGRLKIEKPTIIREVDKTEFDKYIAE